MALADEENTIEAVDWGAGTDWNVENRRQDRRYHDRQAFRREHLGQFDASKKPIPGEMRPDRDTWLYCDRFGQVWRLTPTADPHLPLVIELVSR